LARPIPSFPNGLDQKALFFALDCDSRSIIRVTLFTVLPAAFGFIEELERRSTATVPAIVVFLEKAV